MKAEDFLPQGECGPCVVCCEWLNIETEEFSKKAGILCHHCTGGGCGIYDTRPSVCRGFYCGWRIIPKMGEDWRPDKSGVIILVVEGNYPKQYDGAYTGFNFVVVGGEKAVLRPGFAEYLSQLVRNRVAVFLSADSPKTLINDFLAPLVGNVEGTRQMLLHLYRLHIEAKAKGLVPREDLNGPRK
jgi:hypothetical protein